MPRPKQYKRINIYLTDKQDQMLRVFAEHLGVTYAELVRRGISDYIKKLIAEKGIA